MSSNRETIIKLAGIGVTGAVFGTAHHFGLGESGTLGALVGAVSHASFGHLVLDFVKDVAKGFNEGTVRRSENRDLHRLIGETIARILDDSAGEAANDPGVQWLKAAAVDFRGEPWMNVTLVGSANAISEPNIPTYFVGNAELIRATPVLEESEWIDLIESVAGPPPNAEYQSGRGLAIGHAQDALQRAARELRQHFAFKLWETAKAAWQSYDLAWPALILRLLSLLVGQTAQLPVAADELRSIRIQIKELSDAVGKAASVVVATMSPEQRAAEIDNLTAIRQYQGDLSAQLGSVLKGQDEIKSLLAGLIERVTNIDRAVKNQAPSFDSTLPANSTATIPLRGELDVLWLDPKQRPISIATPGSLPLAVGTEFQIRVTLTKAAYVYLLWLGSDGMPQPLYPWEPPDWKKYPKESEQRKIAALTLPLARQAEMALAWSIKGLPGLETVILLADDVAKPYRRASELRQRLATIPTTSVDVDPAQLYRLDIGEFFPYRPTRAVDFTSRPFLDPVGAIHSRIRATLSPYFELVVALTFATVADP